MVRRRVTAGVAVGVALLGVLAAALALVGGGGTTDRSDTASSPAIARSVPSGAGAGSAGRDAAGPAPEARTDSSAPLPDTLGRDVVRTAQLTLQVADPTAAARSTRTTVAAAGGFVAEEQADTTGAWLVVRVPVAGLDRLVYDLAATGTVVARSARTDDATDQVVDLDSRVATQQASVTRVRALLAQATSIGDVVAVESELARREADLDSLTRRLATLRDRVALSTLTVELRGTAATPPAAPPPGFGAGLGAGWAGLKVVGAVLATAAGFLLPFLPVLVVGAAVAWVIVRRRRARRRRGGPGPEGESDPGHPHRSADRPRDRGRRAAGRPPKGGTSDTARPIPERVSVSVPGRRGRPAVVHGTGTEREAALTSTWDASGVVAIMTLTSRAERRCARCRHRSDRPDTSRTPSTAP